MSEEQTDERAIVPSVERVVDFYGDNIPAAQVDDGKIFVPLRPLTDFLGLDRRGQQQRVGRDEEMLAQCRSISMQLPGDTQRRAVFCLPLELIPAWLFGVTTSRVKPELQGKLRRYRQECFEVLWRAFRNDIVPASSPPPGLTSAQQTLEMIRAMEHLAMQQVEMESHITQVEGRQGTLEGYMRGFIQDTRSRLTALELRLDPTAVITEEQAAALVIAVKTIAYELEERGKVGTYQSGYARVYSELYRRYDVKTYKNLRRDRYDQAMGWLRQWYDEVTKEGSPTEELATCPRGCYTPPPEGLRFPAKRKTHWDSLAADQWVSWGLTRRSLWDAPSRILLCMSRLYNSGRRAVKMCCAFARKLVENPLVGGERLGVESSVTRSNDDSW